MPREAPEVGEEALHPITGARANNLKNVSAEIPLGVFTCITGVSGGGKSTLIIDTVYRALARKLMGSREPPLEHDRIEGVEHLDKIIDIDQIAHRPHATLQPRHLYRCLHADP